MGILFFYLGVCMSDADDIRARAVALAKRGVDRVQVADRSHTFMDLMKMEKFAKEQEANTLDEDLGGFISTKFGNPS